MQNKALALIGALLFFAGLPVLLLNLGWEFLRREERTRVVSNQFDALERQLTRIKREGNIQEYIRSFLGQLCGSMNEEVLDENAAQRAVETLSKSGLGVVKLHCFDSHGASLRYPGKPREYQKIVQKLYQALSEPESGGNNKLLQQYRSVFVSFLGSIDPNDLVQQKFNLSRVVLNGKPALFFWGTIYHSGNIRDKQEQPRGSEEPTYQGGVIAILEEKDVDPDFALLTLIQKMNQDQSDGFNFGFVNVRDPEKSFPIEKLEEWTKLNAVRLTDQVQRLQAQFKKSHEGVTRLLSILPYDDEKVLVGVQASVVPLNPGLGKAVLLLSFIVTLFVGYWAWRVIYSENQIFIPIRRKLVVLFLYSTAIPITALSLLGYQYVTDRREVLLQGVYKKLTGFIGSLDDSFSVELDKLKSFYKRLARSKAMVTSDWKSLNETGIVLERRNFLQKIFVGNADGKLDFSGPYKKGKPKNDMWADRLIPTFIRKIFSRHMAQSSFNPKALVQDAMIDSFADTLSSAMTGGGSGNAFQRIFEHNETLHEVNLGNRVNYFFTSFVRNPAGLINRLMLILCPKKAACQRYLEAILKKNKPRKGVDEFIRIGYVENFGDRKIFPRELSKYSFVREMFEKVLNTRSQHFSVQDMGGTTYLVVASPLNRIEDHVMVAFYPKHVIDEKVARLTRGLLIVGGVSGIFALFIGLALSRQFLLPIQQLSAGINAIEKRDFQHQIPPLGHDELGSLGTTFNNVIANLEELHVAKIVQETLFPQENLELGEYEIHGKTRSMSDLGGDYFDYFIVENRYLVMLIGDVTGHGVPAALLMTMAKSGVAIIGASEAANVVRVLERLNQMMFETVKKKRMMSFFYAVLDTADHQLHTANAGHNYPFFFRLQEGTAAAVENTSYPLGARKRGVFKDVQFSVSPGNALVMYTDGLIEAKNAAEEPFSYNRFEEAIARLGREVSSAGQLHRQILEEFDAFVGGRPAEDDVTMIVLRRRTS